MISLIQFAGEIHIPRDSRPVGVQLVNNVLHRVSVNAKNISATSRRRQVDELLLVIFFALRRFKVLSVSAGVPVPPKPYHGGWQVRLRTARERELLEHGHSSRI